MRIAVDTTTGDHDVVGIRRHHATQWDVVNVIVGKLLPVHELLRVVKLDPPRASRGGVRRSCTLTDVIDGELSDTDDPPGLAQPRVTVRSDTGVGKDLGIL